MKFLSSCIGKYFAVEVVHDVEFSKASTIPQAIVNEINASHLVGASG